MNENWRLDTFESLIGQTVILKSTIEGGSCDALVSDVESSNTNEGWESFSVMFKSDTPIAQGSLIMQHDEYGELIIFLSPRSETTCEAIFNYQLDDSI